jgi:acetolactate synthase-1/3 small subunit
MSNASTSHYPAAPAAQGVESHILSVIVDNEPGVLARVIGLFSGRGYNIDSLTVSETEHEKHLSRITIATRGTPMVIEQIKNQLDRLVPVHRVVDMTVAGPSIQRELAMVKVRGKGDDRVEALRLADAFRARVIDAGTESFVFEITGASDKIESCCRSAWSRSPAPASSRSRAGRRGCKQGALRIYIVYPKERTMKAKIAKWGNSVALRVPRGLAEDLGLMPGKMVDLKREGTVLAVETAPERRKIPSYRLEDLVAAMDKVAPGDRPKLEDWSAVEAPWPDDDWSDIAPTDAEWANWNPEEWKKRIDAQRKRS